MRRTERSPSLPLNETLWHAFKLVYHQDHANAAMHCAPVRYSPITFRLAEQINDITPVNEDVWSEVYSVLLDMGAYEEDRGR